jgi:hypothetical protein
MKAIYWSFALGLTLAVQPLCAQLSGGLPQTPGPQLGGAISKLFGEHEAFSATMTVEAVPSGATQPIVLPGSLHFLEGSSRFEMDILKGRGLPMPAEVKGQLKMMGLNEMIMISRPKENASYLIYPGLKSYVDMPVPEGAGDPKGEVQVEKKEVGKEQVNGQNTIKHQVKLTDASGQTLEATVWNAPQMKDFPVKIETTENGQPVTMTFGQVKFEKPAAKMFEPPAGFTRYDNVMTMMQEAIMKQFGGGAGGFPPR